MYDEMNIEKILNFYRNDTSPIGDLVSNILLDKSFPLGGSNKAILLYLQQYTLRFPALETVVDELVSKFK